MVERQAENLKAIGSIPLLGKMLTDYLKNVKFNLNFFKSNIFKKNQITSIFLNLLTYLLIFIYLFNSTSESQITKEVNNCIT